MATSPKAFLIELYREYLDTASFLRDQTRSLREDPEVSWLDLKSFEERREACLDGLVVGGDLAVQVAQIRAQEGDPGELYSAVCLFCRLQMRSVVMDIARGLVPDNPERIDAMADALKQECPEAWFEDLIHVPAIQPQDDARLIVAAKVAGFRRWKQAAPMLGKLLHGASAVALPALLSALGRVGTLDMRSLLSEKLYHEDDQVRSTAAHSLLRLGESEVIDFCLKAVPTHAWAAVLTGLAGTRAATQTDRKS